MLAASVTVERVGFTVTVARVGQTVAVERRKN